MDIPSSSGSAIQSNSAGTRGKRKCAPVFTSRIEKIQRLIQNLDEDSDSDESDQYEFLDDSDKDPDVLEKDLIEPDSSSENDADEIDMTLERKLPTSHSNLTENIEEEFFIGKDGTKWSKKEPPKNRRTPQHNLMMGGLPGLSRKSKLLGVKPSILDVWKLIFDENMLYLIVNYTNIKMRSVRINVDNKSSYRDTDVVEMNAFIGLLLLSSICKSNHEDMLSLFSKGPLGRPIFWATMSSKRFELLLRCIRFDDSSTREERKKDDKAAAITEIFNILISNSQEAYVLSENATIDEMLIPFRGKCRFRIYMPSKPAKYGIKVMCLADSRSSYFYNAYIYTGRGSDSRGLNEEEKKLKLPSQSVVRLCKPIEKTNRNITADNWFSSLEIVHELRKRGLTYVGTLRKNKREIPPDFQANRSRPEGSSLYGFADNITIISYVPKKKQICIISFLYA